MIPVKLISILIPLIASIFIFNCLALHRLIMLPQPITQQAIDQPITYTIYLPSISANQVDDIYLPIIMR